MAHQINISLALIFITRPLGQAVKTSPFHGGDMGSIPVGVTTFFIKVTMKIKYAAVAQLVEQLTCNQ